MKPTNTPVVLIVLDGWGYREDKTHNPIAEARTPFFDEAWQHYPHTLLDASGMEVGLPEGQMGNSEVGHMTIGSGMKIPTDLIRIQQALDQGEADTNPVLQSLFDHVKQRSSALHLVGLLGPGGVHAHQDHVVKILEAAKRAGVTKAFIHGFTDGRDTSPQSAAAFVEELEQRLQAIGLGRISTLCGRFFGMDRDRNWDRIQQAEQALFEHRGKAFRVVPSQALRSAYEEGEADEQLMPLVFPGGEGETCSPILRGDAVFFFNFRADRAVQLSRKILDRIKDMDAAFATMTIYADDLGCPVAFPSFVPPVTLAQELSSAGLTQAHIAETEKYAHATYFLNGGRVQPHSGEEHILIESRKVKTHDLAPEMRAKEITDAALDRLEKGTNFLFINYANADMVGHTANHSAIINAIEILDVQLKRLADRIHALNGMMFITADHGNAEQSFDPKGSHAHTAHTTNLVPAILIQNRLTDIRPRGTLADITPTILHYLNLPIPKEMSGKSLIT